MSWPWRSGTGTPRPWHKPTTPTGKRLLASEIDSADGDAPWWRDRIVAIESEAREPAERALAEEAKCHDADRALADQLAEALREAIENPDGYHPEDACTPTCQQHLALAAYEEARK